jgi:hypothetical protein
LSAFFGHLGVPVQMVSCRNYSCGILTVYGSGVRSGSNSEVDGPAARSALPSRTEVTSRARQVRKPLRPDIADQAGHVGFVPNKRNQLDRSSLRNLIVGRCLARLEQHPHAPSEKGDTRNPCNHPA